VYWWSSKVIVAVTGIEYEESSPAHVSNVVTVGVSPCGVGAAAAAIVAAWAADTQAASALFGNSIGKKALNSSTDSAANERSVFILSLSREVISV
jgi:hypothetical protein